VATVRARLASGNPHKLSELAAALRGWTLDLLGADGYPPEDGRTYYENALGKARYGHGLDGADWILGEDSGIEVEGLGGRPGIESARWAGDGDPVALLLTELERAEGAARGARYICELVALSPAGEEVRGTGTLRGRIAEERRGTEGFGYDPVFIPEGEDRTVAELGNQWKARNSHRARAAAALAEAMRER
jgi:XTP/dITP diphosphohydrolase